MRPPRYARRRALGAASCHDPFSSVASATGRGCRSAGPRTSPGCGRPGAAAPAVPRRRRRIAQPLAARGEDRGRRSRAWRRHRCRASARPAAGCAGRSPAICAITTFCWLPPESSPTRWSAFRCLARVRRMNGDCAIARFSAPVGTKPKLASRPSEGRATLSAIGAAEKQARRLALLR